MFCFVFLSLFLSFILNGSMIARFIGHRGSIVVSTFLSFVAFITGILIWFEVVLGSCESSISLFGTWISLGSFVVNWEVYFDCLSANMILTVTVVSFAVHIYSCVYMKNDPHLSLFLGYLSLFTFFMVVLVSAPNMVFMFMGFEGIGICSYLLIGYWSHRLTASKSAMKAIVVNRISDGLLLWTIIWIWWYTGSLEFDLILLNNSNNISSIVSIALLLGCMAKSVQIIFHTWLADSMEGPTPVSALIHAATLVTAGKSFSSFRIKSPPVAKTGGDKSLHLLPLRRSHICESSACRIKIKSCRINIKLIVAAEFPCPRAGDEGNSRTLSQEFILVASKFNELNF